ncbi:MAG: Exodeoxyribonuclease 7 large subunit [Methylococcaceae bacterium NSP1-2]|nr:MAG: Exodeoxyribonuclease 7 large subunit [Methylococcaceae bacterium NSP1-2]
MTGYGTKPNYFYMMDIEERKLFTVTQLNRATSQLLAEYFMTVRVEGELSNLSTPSSGRKYAVRCFALNNVG